MAPTGCSPICGSASDRMASRTAAVAALEAAGQPVVRITVSEAMQIGQEFFRWEMATAVAGAIIGINPFDQPDVEAQKVKTRELTAAYEKSGALPPETPFFTADGIALFADPANAAALKSGAASLAGVLEGASRPGRRRRLRRAPRLYRAQPGAYRGVAGACAG